MIPYKQLSLADILPIAKINLITINMSFFPYSIKPSTLMKLFSVFCFSFYAATGRPCKHLLYPMLKALLLQLIFSQFQPSLLIVFLKYSQELRDFCGFSVVPDASKFTRFKQDFLLDFTIDV